MTSAQGLRRIAVVGAGLMGHGIAQEFAVAGCDVRLHDVSEERLAQAAESIRADLRMLQDIGLVSPAHGERALQNIRLEPEIQAAVGGADLIIEAVFEDLGLKQALFRELDDLAPAGAILASNTSTLLPSSLASVTKRPERVLVAHYFNPPCLLPLVEIVPHADTSGDVVRALHGLLTAIGKKPVIVRREVPGFIANRIQAAVGREALSIVERGIASAQDVDTVVKNGFGRRYAAAGPFEINELAGWDLCLAISRNMLPAIESSTQVSARLEEKVRRGELGVKSGRGFYDWTAETAGNLKRRIGQALAEIARFRDAPPERSEASRFLGSWRLVSVECRTPDGAVIPHRWGGRVTGRLTYGADGRMSVQLMHSERRKFEASDLLCGTDVEIRDAYLGHNAYYGSYSVRPSEQQVIHHVERAWHPNWEGTDQVRRYDFRDDRLELRADLTVGGVEQVETLVWQRLAPCGEAGEARQ